MPKRDGGGVMEGNFVGEVHATGIIKPEVGVKNVVTHSAVESALTRNAGIGAVPGDDLPF